MPRVVNFATKDDLIAFLMQGMNYIAVEGKNPEADAAWLADIARDMIGTVNASGWEIENQEEEPWLWNENGEKEPKH